MKCVVETVHQQSSAQSMGCCASLPKADEFLVTQNVPPEIRLMTAAPETLRMTGWSIVTGYTDYEKQGFGTLIRDDKHKGPDTGVVRKDGPADVLTISDVQGTTIATLQMPPHQSFGACATPLSDDASACWMWLTSRLHAVCTQASLPR